jgi:peptidoglycan/xylan/chitin deacetylase (PgdA/CDA1 family)
MSTRVNVARSIAFDAHDSAWVGVVLGYHRIAGRELDPWGLRVSADRFAEQLERIRELGNPTALPDFVGSLHSRDVQPMPSVVVTFDDGYVDNLTHALPILKAFDIPATLFICSGYIGRPYFWWEALEHIFLRPNSLPRKLTLNLPKGPRTLDLGGGAAYSAQQYELDRRSCRWRGEPGSRVRVFHDVYDVLWSEHHEARLAVVDEIVRWAGLGECFEASRPMTADEVRLAGGERLITIGAHSVNHIPLDAKPAALLESEILGSRRQLETILDRPVQHFAYPHGKYCSETVGTLDTLGFRSACTTEEKPVTSVTNPLLLPRLAVGNWTGAEFSERLRKVLGDAKKAGSSVVDSR